MRGWLEATDANAPVLTWVRALLSTSESDARGSYLIGDGLEQARISFSGTRIVMEPSADPRATPVLKTPAEQHPDTTGMPHDLSVEVTTTDQNGKRIVPTQINVGIYPDGVRLSHRSTWKDNTAEQEKAKHVTALPTVDDVRFRSLPADTMVAATVALTSESSRASGLFAWIGAQVSAPQIGEGGEPGQAKVNGSLGVYIGPHGPEMKLTALTGETQTKLVALRRALEQVDGAMTMWVQPGTPIPVLSLTIDLSPAAADDLIAGLGLTPDASGIAHHDQIHLAWRTGRLVITNHPQGPDAVVESGGFTEHEEVKAALTTMSGPSQFKAILRPTALMNQVQAFAPLLLAPEQQQQFSAYHQRVQEAKVHAFLSMGANADGFFLDAGGLLAMIAGVAIGQMMVDPALLIQAIN